MKKFFALALCLTVFGCSVSNEPSSELTGTLVGRAYSIKEGTASEFEAHEKIRVEIEGTGLSTSPDSLGNWRIDNVPTRAISIAYSKAGFATVRQNPIMFVGGGIIRVPEVYLYKIPDCGVSLDSSRMLPNDRVQIYSHLDCPDQASIVTFFFSNSRSVSSEDYSHYVLASGQLGVSYANPYKSELGQYLNANDSIFVSAYHGSYGYGYLDSASNKFMFSGLNPNRSQVIGFKF